MSQETVSPSESEATQEPEEVLVLAEQDLSLVESADEIQQTEPPQKRRKFSWWMLPVLGLILAVGGLSVYRLQGKNSEVAAVAERAPLSVRTVAAVEGDIQAWVSSEGTVQAVRFKHLAFDVDGDITYLVSQDGRSLRAGDLVQQGELLAQIDDRRLQADVIQAESSVNEVRRQRGAAAASVAQAEAGVASARAQVAQAEAQRSQAVSSRTLAQTESQRYQALYEQGAISNSELDNRINTFQDAGAQSQSADAQVQSAQAQVSTAQAQVVAAQQQLQAVDSQIDTALARLEQARIALEGTQIYAPFDGVVAYLNIRENEYYSQQAVSSQLGNYQELLNRVPIVVIDPSDFEVVAELPASSGDRIKSGQTALITPNVTQVASTSNNLADRAEARGEVYSVTPAVSPGNRSIDVTAQISSGFANLQHGGSVTLWVAADEKENAVVVPLNAVVFRNQVPYVFVVNDENIVEQREVELGVEGLDKREILSGVKPGEQLVTEGQNGLVDGAEVNVTQSDFTAMGGQ
ncbi:efflux RND transporter periplasmic adaptor subunit [cf. Phormidesmis sp. LEGE 11477]|uniref:efflux RND transporter periplasmic adaptor subunit n=1 Tax=cf. Phormidesmis sp. LEGE 11477 TaxID=1828680 RepID=UPI0018805832|nr:efflux RND transporter periplasmic adaptor subunit [cf. Phormidesmis sp. LEGE 11477]MBE9063412.1 efflux RND transporter periplasmic adaptor subunit [cf. Phormidesmis sp. LEGE 11477]